MNATTLVDSKIEDEITYIFNFPIKHIGNTFRLRPTYRQPIRHFSPSIKMMVVKFGFIKYIQAATTP